MYRWVKVSVKRICHIFCIVIYRIYVHHTWYTVYHNYTTGIYYVRQSLFLFNVSCTWVNPLPMPYIEVEFRNGRPRSFFLRTALYYETAFSVSFQYILIIHTEFMYSFWMRETTNGITLFWSWVRRCKLSKNTWFVVSAVCHFRVIYRNSHIFNACDSLDFTIIIYFARHIHTCNHQTINTSKVHVQKLKG